MLVMRVLAFKSMGILIYNFEANMTANQSKIEMSPCKSNSNGISASQSRTIFTVLWLAATSLSYIAVSATLVSALDMLYVKYKRKVFVVFTKKFAGFEPGT